jgi:hypothetical protein
MRKSLFLSLKVLVLGVALVVFLDYHHHHHNVAVVKMLFNSPYRERRSILIPLPLLSELSEREKGSKRRF